MATIKDTANKVIKTIKSITTARKEALVQGTEALYESDGIRDMGVTVIAQSFGGTKDGIEPVKVSYDAWKAARQIISYTADVVSGEIDPKEVDIKDYKVTRGSYADRKPSYVKQKLAKEYGFIFLDAKGQPPKPKSEKTGGGKAANADKKASKDETYTSDQADAAYAKVIAYLESLPEEWDRESMKRVINMAKIAG